MTGLEDRLRQDLPALADLLMEGQAAQEENAAGEIAADAIAEGPALLVDLGVQPAPRTRRWPTVVAAAATAVAAVAVLLIYLADRSEVTTTGVIAARQDGASEPETPEPREGVPETPEPPGGSETPEPLEGSEMPSDPIEAPTGEPRTTADEAEIPNGQSATSQEPQDGELEAPLASPVESATPDRPGEGVEVIAGRADWNTGYFQAALYKRLLEELGYDVSDPAELEMSPAAAYAAMARGDMDYWPNGWYPSHFAYLGQEMPDGSLVGDHVDIVGEQLLASGLQGFLVTKSFADTYGVYTIDDLNDDPEALAAFDATDHAPGNGKAEIYGCAERWTCDNIIENMIAFSGWDNIVQIVGDYDPVFDRAVSEVNRDVPMVLYTWTPSRYITVLRPGDNVYWMGVENILDDSNPTGDQHGHGHNQRGPDGTGGYAAIGPDQCPAAADQPDGKCPIGWLANDIFVTANSAFLEANPAARLLFTAVRLTLLEVSVATDTLRSTGVDPNDLAAEWIADNRDRVDQWLAAAREAVG